MPVFKRLKNRNGSIQTKNKNFNLKIELNGKRLYETNYVKYLGIGINSKFYWKAHTQRRYSLTN